MTDKSEIRRKIKNMRKMLDEADKAMEVSLNHKADIVKAVIHIAG